MRKITLLFLLLACCEVRAQFTAGIPYATGAPSGAPSASGSRLRCNLATGRFYLWSPTASAWQLVPYGIEEKTDCAAPSHTPGYGQSPIVINRCTPNPEVYYYFSGSWHLAAGGGGGGGSGTVSTDATLSGDGSSGSPLKIAQQSAATAQGLSWTGSTWSPSWGNPYTFTTTTSTISTDVNEVLVGTLSANVVFGLPTCNLANDSKRFKFVRNGTDAFSMTIDPSSTQAFYDGDLVKTMYGKISIDCTCRFSSGTGVWFFDNF